MRVSPSLQMVMAVSLKYHLNDILWQKKITMPNNDDYAILIGIDNYLSFDPLTGVAEDVAGILEWLLDPNGGDVPQANIHTILAPPIPDPEDPQPVQDKINQKFRKLGVMAGNRIGRRLYFYFSGHGYGQIDDVGMLMGNASARELKNNIGLKNYRNFLLEWGFFDELIFFLDCCRDPIRHAETGIPPFTIPDELLPAVPPRVNHVTILACIYGKQAFMIPKQQGAPEKRGLLSKAFLEGVKDHLATDSQGNITTSSLMDYLVKRVPELAGVHNINQEPEYFTPQPVRNIILKQGIVKKKQIGILLSPSVTSLLIEDNSSTEIARYMFVNSAWSFQYLTQDPVKQQSVIRLSEAVAATALGTSAIITVELIWNCWYNLECSNGQTEILDMRKINSNTTDNVFQFQ